MNASATSTLRSAARSQHLALLSAPSAAEVEAAADALGATLADPSDLPAALVQLHAASGPASHRAALLVCDSGEGEAVRERLASEPVTLPRPVAFMFPGVGDHHPNMASGLYWAVPRFRDEVDRCAELLRPELGLDLRDVLYPRGDGGERGADPDGPEAAGADRLRRILTRERHPASPDEAALNRPSVAQPALFVIEYALAALWRSWGVQVDVMIGYSLGEYVAACLAGVLSLEDSLVLVARRGQWIEESPAGAMLAVALPAAAVEPLLGTHLALSAVNGPTMCVVGGPVEEVELLAKQLAARAVAVRPVQTSHAFHTSAMNPIACRLTELVRSFTRRPPATPYVSNVTGAVITAGEACDPGYWAAHLCRPVRFAEGLDALAARPDRVLVEVGPGQTLTSLATLHAAAAASRGRVVVASMRHAWEPQPDVAVLLRGARRLWLSSALVDWGRFPIGPLVAPQHADPPGGESPAAPRVGGPAPEPTSFANETERTLAAVWSLLFPGQDVHADASFFQLGGNSLIATRLVERIVESFRVELPLRRIYEAPGLCDMAAAIDAARQGGDEAAGSAGRWTARPVPPLDRAMSRIRLPNGLVIWHRNEGETRHFYDDIFTHRSYLRQGIRVPDGGCIFDVGANIGLFTLLAHHEARDVHIFAFEPAPALCELLRQNAAEHGVQAAVFACGLSDREGEAIFTFYPRSSGMSSFHADEAEERHVLRTIIANQRAGGMSELAELEANADALLDLRLEPIRFMARLRRLSDVVREQRVERIDLLKVDVQKCELEVLMGIDERDWPKIAQIALEVHDEDGRVAALRDLLERRGFAVAVHQDELYVGTNIHNLYAVRDGA